jgi:hypothetical protein
VERLREAAPPDIMGIPELFLITFYHSEPPSS